MVGMLGSVCMNMPRTPSSIDWDDWYAQRHDGYSIRPLQQPYSVVVSRMQISAKSGSPYPVCAASAGLKRVAYVDE